MLANKVGDDSVTSWPYYGKGHSTTDPLPNTQSFPVSSECTGTSCFKVSFLL